MNVLILELGGSHFENIYSLIHLLKIKGCRLHLICNQKLVGLLPDSKDLEDIMAVPDSFTLTSQFSTLLSIRKYLRKHNIQTIIIGTTEATIIRNLTFFLPRMNCVGIVHNARKLEGNFKIAHIIFRRVKKFLVFGDYIFRHTNPVPKFKVSSFYAIYFPPVTRLMATKKEDEKWIVFPGVVDGSRKDYFPLFDALEKTDLPGHIRMIFLGYLNESTQGEIKARIAKLEKQGKQITWFNHYLDYDLFHSYLQQADVLVPLYRISGDNFYADARVSGTVHLGIAYHIPFLLPSTHINDDIEPYSIYYKNEYELAVIIQQIDNRSDQLNKLKDNYNNTAKFDDHIQAEKLYQFIIS